MVLKVLLSAVVKGYWEISIEITNDISLIFAKNF